MHVLLCDLFGGLLIAACRADLLQFWTNVMFVLFIIYPVVSITSMRAFNCDSNLGLLKDDYTMLCPPLSSFTCIYSAVFFVIYPIGIPVFMTTSMRVMGIAQIVKEKMEIAQFSAMLSLFMKISCSVESQVCGWTMLFIAYLVWQSARLASSWRTPMQLTPLCTYFLHPACFSSVSLALWAMSTMMCKSFSDKQSTNSML